MSDIMGMMKRAQQLQANMQRLQQELAEMEIEGASGGGMVKATLNGQGQLKRIAIDPSLLKPDEAEIVEDLVVAAVTDGRGRAEAIAQERMQALTAGLPIPPGMKLF